VNQGPFATILRGGPDLRTDRFTLRPLGANDSADFLAHLSDPAVVRFMDIEPLRHLEEALSIIAWAQTIRAAGAGVRWAIRDRVSGGFVGSCGFNSLVWERGCRGEVAYDVTRPLWGLKVMDEVLPVVLGFGFRGLGLRRIEAMVTAGNHPSSRLLERHGFEREGVLREHGYWKDQFWDQEVYGLLG